MKLLTSNLSFKEQHNLISKQVADGYSFDISFLGYQLSGITNSKIGILTKGVSDKKENVLAVLRASFLKDLFLLLQTNTLKRNFEINFTNKILTDFLLDKEINIKDEILFSRIENYLFPSELLFMFKLNLKTINSKSEVFLFEDKIIYENNRGTETAFYLFKK